MRVSLDHLITTGRGQLALGCLSTCRPKKTTSTSSAEASIAQACLFRVTAYVRAARCSTRAHDGHTESIPNPPGHFLPKTQLAHALSEAERMYFCIEESRDRVRGRKRKKHKKTPTPPPPKKKYHVITRIAPGVGRDVRGIIHYYGTSLGRRG